MKRQQQCGKSARDNNSVRHGRHTEHFFPSN
jgi:hypothetical protein